MGFLRNLISARFSSHVVLHICTYDCCISLSLNSAFFATGLIGFGIRTLEMKKYIIVFHLRQCMYDSRVTFSFIFQLLHATGKYETKRLYPMYKKKIQNDIFVFKCNTCMHLHVS